jgi:hypothetical protein
MLRRHHRNHLRAAAERLPLKAKDALQCSFFIARRAGAKHCSRRGLQISAVGAFIETGFKRLRSEGEKCVHDGRPHVNPIRSRLSSLQIQLIALTPRDVKSRVTLIEIR